ncbi:MAG: hypothetical protein ACRDYD_11180 [Acidimicrobiales bacterium]
MRSNRPLHPDIRGQVRLPSPRVVDMAPGAPLAVPASMSLERALQWLWRHPGHEAALVVAGGGTVGVLLLAEAGRLPTATRMRLRASQLAIPLRDLWSVPGGMPAAELVETSHTARRDDRDPLLVRTDDGEIVGLVSMAGIRDRLRDWLDRRGDAVRTSV